MRKFLLISPKNRTVYNFRGDLIRDIISRGYEVSVVGPDRTDIEKVLELGVDFVEIPVNKNGTSILGDLRYCKKLIRFMKELRPDIVLGYTVKPSVYGAMAAKIAGVKNINCMITGAGYTFSSNSFKAKLIGFIVRMLYRIGLGCANNVIFQNNDDRNEFVKKKLVKEGKCSVVNGSGVNVTHFVPTEFPERISFFMLSRLLKNKGVREYLGAAEVVKEMYPDVDFYLLGKYETNMQDAVPADVVEEYISRGIIKRFEETTDVRPYYAMSSVFVLPSYREGTPRTVLEAMAMGRPIITTDAPGCRDTVIDGENGFIVPVGSKEAIAEKMICFIKKPEMIVSLGKKSLEIAKEKYDVSIVNADMLRIMDI